MKTVEAVCLINTLLQRGASKLKARRNRFNGFSNLHETVKTVSTPHGHLITPLKRGVNDTATRRGFPISRIWAIRSEHATS